MSCAFNYIDRFNIFFFCCCWSHDAKRIREAAIKFFLLTPPPRAQRPNFFLSFFQSFKNFLFSQWPGPYHPLSGRANKKKPLFFGGLLIHFKICADCQKSQEKVFFFSFIFFFHIYVAVLCLFFHSIFSSIFFAPSIFLVCLLTFVSLLSSFIIYVYFFTVLYFSSGLKYIFKLK